MATKRNYGIDLLRLVFMYMVCVLHILGQGGVLAATPAGSVSHGVFWFLEVCAYCAVDGFAIISGYTASNKPIQYHRIINMWFQVLFYSFFLTVILSLGLHLPLTKDILLKGLTPVNSQAYWYFTAYFGLFFFVPILNSFLFTVEEKTAKHTFLLFVVIFSLLGTWNDSFRTSKGYSMLWLMILYCLGALAKRIRLFETRKNSTLLLALGANTLLSLGLYLFFENKKLISYTAPTILFNGLILVILFSRFQLKGTWIAKLAPLAFGVYLFQLNRIIWTTILKKSLVWISETGLVMGIIYVLSFSGWLFVAGLCVEFVRSKLAALLRISDLSKAIANHLEKALSAPSSLLH